jgi:exodeoxyribonuclease V gamma subunit
VPNVRDLTIVQCVYSRLAAKHRLASWVRFLALTADRPGGAVRALSVGKGQRAGSVSVARLEPVPATVPERRDWAVDRLHRLVGLYDLGMREPLPLICKTSAAWAEGRRERLDQPGMLARAQQHWDGGTFGRECDEDEHVYVYGRGFPFLSLLQDGPTEEDRRLGWPEGERTRFGGLSRLLWDPLLEVEEAGA